MRTKLDAFEPVRPLTAAEIEAVSGAGLMSLVKLVLVLFDDATRNPRDKTAD